MLRFAPSPTGDMTIDQLRIALCNYIVASQRGEEFIVRIEDTKKECNIEGKDQEILDLLALFKIEYSQVIYQSQNVRFHAAMALQLLHEKKAFSCFCSSAWIEKKQDEARKEQREYHYDDACRYLPAELVIDNTNPFTVRITRPNKALVIEDLVKGELHFKPDVVDSFIVMNQDKTPTNNFASAVDDMLSDISLVVRSEDFLKDTSKQVHVRNSLAYDKKIIYAHLPTLLDANVSVKRLLEDGFLPEAILNYLILTVGKVPQEIFTMSEAKEFFKLSELSNNTVSFNIEHLKEINKKHLLSLDPKELSRYVGFADEEIGNLARLYLQEVQTTKELKSKIAPIFASRKKVQSGNELYLITECIKDAPYFEEYKDFLKYITKETGLKEEHLLNPLRLLLCNASEGPDLSEIYKYLKNYLGEIVK